MRYKITFVIVSVILMIGAVFYVALDRQNKQYKVFTKQGYILASSNIDSNESERYYFSAGSKYKEKYPSNIVFSDINGKDVALPDSGVVHYIDGSISVLKKSVIMDADDLNNEIIKYYNFFDQTILENSNGDYTVNNAGKRITFTNFIIKISDNKYVLVSKNLKLKTNDTEKVISGYLEMTIMDGNVIKLQNQEVTLQTVATNAYILIGDKAKLDLSNSKIYYDDKEKFTISQLVIDSDDNIPIEQDETTTNSSDNSNGSINVGSNGSGNNFDNGEKEVDDVATTLPSFSIVNMLVTSNKIDATIKITDSNNMLIGNITTKIVESGSGKVVYLKEEATGTYSLDAMLENLSPNTNYTLIVNSDYIKEGVTYNRDFLTKSFRTELLGMNITKNYFTKSTLSFIVGAESYSNIKSAEVLLLDNNDQVLKRYDVNGDQAKSGAIVTFDELNSNTSYKVKLTNFLYDSVIISNGFDVQLNCKTLKNKPTFGNTSFIIDKKSGSFTLKVNNVSDTDNGIENYKYVVYDARTLNSDSLTPISVIEKNKLGSVDLPVDQTTVIRGVPYTFKMVAEFYDNEKYIEYETSYSEVFKMDGVQFPAVRFEPSNVTFERIEGTLIITDEGNTISLDSNLITVVYTNSTGNSKSFTTSGNLSIPFSANNLRANETYTISVYTAVNLQDGNQTIDNCFVGSVVVKTGSPNEMVANYTVNSGSVTTAFSITSILGTRNGIDNVLEANTLTGIVFNLYSGQSTSGTIIKSVRKVDRNLSPYLSDLRSAYYDRSFLITPEFFGMSNGDMTEEYYTIEVIGAYDYTDYKNSIPIINQTITVKSNGFIPDLPPDVNNAVEVNAIRNKDAGSHYNESLNADTVVGYKIKGGYDNSRLYAKYLKYYIYNADTDVALNPQGTVVNVGDSGTIDYIEFYLNNGTPYGTVDTTFTRGNKYYFTYEAYLDLNFDGNAETVYPYQTGGNITTLKSEVVTPSKQEPIFNIYPSNSTSNTMTFKYMYRDIDNALISDNIYYKINGSEKGSVGVQRGTPQYSSVTFNNLTKGYLGLEISQALIKQSSSIARKSLVYQSFDSVFSMKQLSFHTSIDVNRLIISIVDYDSNANYVSRIAALKVTFSSGTINIVKDNLALTGDSVIIDLADIKDLISTNVTVGVQAYYDTGITGFDITGSKLALQSILKDGIGGEYLTINSGNNLRGDLIANGSIYNMTFSPTSLVLNNLNSTYSKTITTTCDQSGISFNYEYLLAKKLDFSTLLGDGTQTFTFNTIVPGISLLNSSGHLNISSTLRTAQAIVKFYGANASQIQDNKFYVELYETNDAGTTSIYKSTTEIVITGPEMTVNITGLNPKTPYFIKIYGNIYNGSEYVKTQLYDTDFKTNTKIYYFSTLSSVGISNVSVRYLAATYNNKVIRITYNLNQIVGYDKLKYTLYKYVKDNNGVNQKVLVNTNISNDVIFNKSMIKDIPCVPGSDFTFGQNYNLVIVPIAYVMIDGQQTEVELDNRIDYNFYLDQLRLPFIGIIGTATDDLSLEFKVSVSDIHKIIVSGTYTIKVLDYNNNDITPINYKNVAYNINVLNNMFTITELERNKEYKIVVTIYIDRQNNTTNIEKYETTYIKSTLDDSGIDIGDLYTSMNSTTKSKIDLLFYNSYKLTYITGIRYSIYNFSGYAQDNMVDFVPTQVNGSGGGYYIFTLPETLPTSGLYYIELQFIYDGRVIKEIALEHNYVGN